MLAQDTSAELQKYSEQGKQALSEHRYADAEEAYKKLGRLSPGTAEVYATLGFIYFQEGKFDQAVPTLRRGLKLKPALPNADVLLAMSLAELGHYEEAVPGLEKGFRRSSEKPLQRMVGLQLIRAYTGLQRDREAVQTALELGRLFPNDPEVLYHTSRIYANFAFLTLRKLSEVAPNSVWRRQAAAEADESQGNLDLAVSEYREVLKIDPERRGIHYRIGRALLAGSHSGEALGEFEQELKLDPSNANAAYEIGEIYRKAGQLDKAQEFFSQALKYYPDFEEAQLGLGGVLIAQRKPDQAVPHLQKAAALNPADEVSYYRLAQAYNALGNSREQQKALAEFQRLRADSAHSHAAEFSRPQEVTRQEIDSTAPQ